jgi:zinc transporter
MLASGHFGFRNCRPERIFILAQKYILVNIFNGVPNILQCLSSYSRRQIASVWRFLAPQCDALDRWYRNPGQLLKEAKNYKLREKPDRFTRYLETLDLARERATVLKNQYLSQLAMEHNQCMCVLSVVAAIFPPLRFLTGLFGTNVGGIPWSEQSLGFLYFGLLTFGLVGAQL